MSVQSVGIVIVLKIKVPSPAEHRLWLPVCLYAFLGNKFLGTKLALVHLNCGIKIVGGRVEIALSSEIQNYDKHTNDSECLG